MNDATSRTRRQILRISAATGLMTAAGAWIGGPLGFAAMAAETATVPVADLMAAGVLPDMPMGKADAPCTIVEYASMTCPHCAAFHAETYPTLKTEYIDTGKVQFIMREFPLDQYAALASMLARYAGPDKRNAMVDLLFSTQKTWASGEKVVDNLETLVKQTGMTSKTFEDCLSDKELFAKILKSRDEAQQKFGVASTPTFFINGTRKAGGFDVAELRSLVDPLLTKG